MMKSIDFIINELHILSAKLPYLEVQYEYRERNSTHIIEIKPIHCFEKDSHYIDFEIDLKDRFSELFINEDLLFISVESLNKIENPILKLGVSHIDVIDGIVTKEDKLVLDEKLFFDIEIPVLVNSEFYTIDTFDISNICVSVYPSSSNTYIDTQIDEEKKTNLISRIFNKLLPDKSEEENSKNKKALKKKSESFFYNIVTL